MRAMGSANTTLYVIDPVGLGAEPDRIFGGDSGFAQRDRRLCVHEHATIFAAPPIGSGDETGTLLHARDRESARPAHAPTCARSK